MREVVPSDPSRDEYRQGNTLGAAYRHWRRAKIGRRFRLFFRYDSKANVIVFAWVNDEQTLRSAGSKSDRSEEHTSELQSLMRISYAVFCLKKKNKYQKHEQNN